LRMSAVANSFQNKLLELFERAILQCPAGIRITDPSGVVIFQNESARRLFGRPDKGLIGRYNILEDKQLIRQGVIPSIKRVFEHVGSAELTVEYAMPGAAPEHRRKALRIFLFSVADETGRVRNVVLHYQDYTEHWQVQKSLEEAEARYRSLVDFSPDAITIHSEGKIVFTNAAGAALLGARSPQELVGRPVLDFVHPDYRKTVKQRIRRMIEERVKVPLIEEKFIKLDGSAIDVEVAAMPVTFEGKPAALVMTRDITERKRAEEDRETVSTVSRLFLASESLTSLYAELPKVLSSRFAFPIVAVELYDADAGEMVFSGSTGIPEQGPTPMRVRIDQTISGTVATTKQPVLETHATARSEYQFGALRRLGVETFVCVPMTSGDRVIGTLALADPVRREVSSSMLDTLQAVANYTAQAIERLHAEEASRRSGESLRAMFDYAPAGVIAFDSEGIILQANPAFERLVGFPRDRLIGRPMFETIVRPEDRARTKTVIAGVFKGETFENLEWEDLRANGSTVHVLTNITPVYNASGNVMMGISLGIDVTERKLAEERQRELDQHKRDFYRRTILAATEGKLHIVERAEIEKVAGPPIASWKIKRGEDLGVIRHAVGRIAQSMGMDEDRIFDFVLCAGEATTNALKHAGRGAASLHEIAGGLMLVVSDRGPGIDALTLPEVSLKRGYSTAGSLGMGYKSILSVADKVYLATGPTGTTVAIEMKLQEVEKPLAVVVLPDTWLT